MKWSPVIADIAFSPWIFVRAFWPYFLIGVIIIAIVILLRVMNKRKKK